MDEVTTKQGLAHTPVMVEEVLAHFQPKEHDRLLDATLGLGGHSAAYLAAAGGTQVVGIEADANALEQAKQNLAAWDKQVRYIAGNFADLQEDLKRIGITGSYFTHVLFDLGVGSHQLSDTSRGFSFASTGSLSMKFGEHVLPPSQLEAVNVIERRLQRHPDAHELIRYLSEKDLADLIHTYGEERYARRIAKAIKNAEPATATQLTQVVREAVPAIYAKSKIHPATRTFQALRLAVNRELEAISAALPQALEVLAPGGKLAVISFHSLEDRIVKRFFRNEAQGCICPPQQVVCTCNHKPRVQIATKKPLRPSEQEVQKNPRARSAKLRVAIKKE